MSDAPSFSSAGVPLVSVLIPAWNVAPWIAETLRSVLAQTVADFECIIVDDGSTDSTAQVVLSFTDPRIRLIRQENLGVSAARNRALDEAKGRFIAFLDADDFWEPRFLEKLLAVLEASPEADLAFCDRIMFMDGTSLIKRQPWANVHATGNAWWDMLQDAVFCMGAWIARREAVPPEMRFPADIPVAEDRDFLLRLLAHIYAERQRTAAGIPDSLLWYRQRPGSGVRQAGAALRDEWRLMAPHLEHPGVPERIRRLGYSNLAFKMGVIAAFGLRDFPQAIAWYGKALRLAPLNLNLYWLPLRKLVFSLLPAKPAWNSILFLTLRADFGGGPEHLWQLLRRLPDGVRARVACPRDYPYYERYCEHLGRENVFVLPHRKFRLSALWRLRAFCRKRGVAVLHSHGKGAGVYSRLLAFLTGLPCAHTFHGVHTAQYGPAKKRLYRLYERGMALFTDAGIAVSEGERRQILAQGLFPDNKLRLIENGVNIPAEVTPPAAAAPCTVVSMSRFDYQKNSEFLIDILESLRRSGRLADFRIVAVGDGKGRSGLEALAQERGLADSLYCAGASPNPNVFFAGALCCLSTSRWEGMPLAVLEAMAHGLPAVVTDVVGNRDAVRHGETGFLYPEGDAEATAAALCRLADEPDLRRTLGEQAKEYVRRRHDARKMTDRTLELLRRIAGGKF